MFHSRSAIIPLITACVLAITTCNFCLSFVGLSSTANLRSKSAITREVGVDYLLRNGPKNADPPPVNVAGVSGATKEVTFKKRPFGIARYAPGTGGKGAVVMEVTQKSRYPGDPQGQAFVAGVQAGWVVKSVNGKDVTGVVFEEIMQMLDDEVLDPVAAMSLNLKASGVQTNLKNDGTERKQGSEYAITSELDKIPVIEMPATIVYAAR